MMENNETGVKVPKGQINLNTVLGAIGTAGALIVLLLRKKDITISIF